MRIETIRIGDLALNEKNIRTNLNVDDLIDSIQESGVLVPLIVTPDYTVVDGNRRLEAARRVFGEDALITVDIRNLSEQEIIEYSLITALQRENLTEKEKANAYKQLSILGLSDFTIAKKIGKKKTNVNAYIKAADIEQELWETHTLDELQFIAEYPELANYTGRALIDRYDRLVAQEKFNNWLNDFSYPENTSQSIADKWYENEDYGFDGLAIKSDNKLYHNGEVIAEDYHTYPYAPNTLIHAVSNELWIIEPKEQESATEAENEPQEALKLIDESDIYEGYLEVWGGIVERVKRKVEEVRVRKEPALSLVGIICKTYGFDDLKDMALDSFETLAIEPFFMRDGKIEHRECECLDFINAMTTLSDAERVVISGKQ
ncbi:MAG: ParB/RepB/Spo0J family partition protein [Clostridia bacterium]